MNIEHVKSKLIWNLKRQFSVIIVVQYLVVLTVCQKLWQKLCEGMKVNHMWTLLSKTLFLLGMLRDAYDLNLGSDLKIGRFRKSYTSFLLSYYM